MSLKGPVNFVFFDLPPPKSFDPLDADQGINLNMMRMLYLTPLEISLENKLQSSILRTFSYDISSRKIQFEVASGKKFSDGNDITTYDVLLSILRMAAFRPDFPVIKDIVGIKSWSKLKSPLKSLPEGISIEGSLIEIKLNRPQHSPLFRFTLELFSIIPANCIDLYNGNITCEQAPFSGYYRLDSKTPKSITFKKRSDYVGSNFEDTINFTYEESTLQNLERSLEDERSILYGMDLRLKDESLRSLIKTLHFEWLPAARFVYLAINPQVKPFDKVQCRRAFMDIFRQVSKDLFKSNLTLSSSIFTPITPGYLDDNKLNDSINEKISTACSNELKSAEIPWHISQTSKLALSEEIIFETMRRLNINSKPKVTPFDERELQFIAGENAFYAGSSGFWAEDPVGDLQMFFTPNLHKIVQFTIQSRSLTNQLNSLDASDFSVANLQEINKTLYQDALFNVFMHSRRFFASKNPNLLVSLPQAVSSPAFYQVIQH